MKSNLLPNDDILGWHILGLAHRDLAVDLGRVQRGWDLDDDIVGAELGREVGLDVYGVVDAGFANLFDDWLHPEGEVDVRRGAVAGRRRERKERRGGGGNG